MARKKTIKDCSYKFIPDVTYTITAFKEAATIADGEKAFQQKPVAPITILGSLLQTSGIYTVQDYLTNIHNPFKASQTIHFLIKDFESGIFTEVASGNKMIVPGSVENIKKQMLETDISSVPFPFNQPSDKDRIDKTITDTLKGFKSTVEVQNATIRQQSDKMLTDIKKQYEDKIKIKDEHSKDTLRQQIDYQDRIFDLKNEHHNRIQSLKEEYSNTIISQQQEYNKQILELNQKLLDETAKRSAIEARSNELEKDITRLEEKIEWYERMINELEEKQERNTTLQDAPPEPSAFEKIMTVAMPVLQNPELMSKAGELLGALKSRLLTPKQVPSPVYITQPLNTQVQNDIENTKKSTSLEINDVHNVKEQSAQKEE